jgi:UDP-N-acetylmuramoyl-L-alanyl-D-glutamate--2,6-diaminopimelate ligase
MLQKIKDALWHPGLAFVSALLNGFPARSMTVIGVTGTKGKSTVCEMLYAILNAAGHKTALLSTIRFAYPGHEERNMFKMTMPGRGYIQGILAKAKRAGATHAVVEITSEGARQSRHAFLYLDGLVVTNIHKEHIESHGSFKNYIAAKRAIVTALERSPKNNRVLVVNGDNELTKTFLDADVEVKKTFAGSRVPGDFNNANARATVAMAEALGIARDIAEKAIKEMPQVRGRAEAVKAGQPFRVVVDYAHTPESMQELYGAYPGPKICVFGSTGGLRDHWKRPLMGKIADEHCKSIILTNDDPYNEDPEAIMKEIAEGMERKPGMIIDRRAAIREALRQAQDYSDQNVIVLIMGKGTDPFLMEAGGKKTPWDDATVVREELAKLGYSKGV